MPAWSLRPCIKVVSSALTPLLLERGVPSSNPSSTRGAGHDLNIRRPAAQSPQPWLWIFPYRRQTGSRDGQTSLDPVHCANGSRVRRRISYSDIAPLRVGIGKIRAGHVGGARRHNFQRLPLIRRGNCFRPCRPLIDAEWSALKLSGRGPN